MYSESICAVGIALQQFTFYLRGPHSKMKKKKSLCRVFLQSCNVSITSFSLRNLESKDPIVHNGVPDTVNLEVFKVRYINSIGHRF
jgi:hypothetical protein